MLKPSNINVKHTASLSHCTNNFPTLRKLKGQSVTFLSKHLTTQIHGGWWWNQYQFMIGWNIFHYYTQIFLYGPTQPHAKQSVGQIPSGGRWYSHASSAHDKASFPCTFLSARNSCIMDNNSINQWQYYFLPLLHFLNKDFTLVWHGRILNILKFSMINGEFSARSWMFKLVSHRTLLTQV